MPISGLQDTYSIGEIWEKSFFNWSVMISFVNFGGILNRKSINYIIL